MWYCKYCKRSMKDSRKRIHVELNSHKTKASRQKYFTKLDYFMERLKEDYERGLLSVDDFNIKEQEIYDDLWKAEDEGYFDNLPDSDDENEEKEI